MEPGAVTEPWDSAGVVVSEGFGTSLLQAANSITKHKTNASRQTNFFIS